MNHFRSRIQVFLAVLLLLPAAAAASVPDWAERMVGRWRGEGVRVDADTGSRTQVQVEVISEWHPELPLPALVSQNHFQETQLDADGNPVRTWEYDRIYWIREQSRQGARAELSLGAGTDSSGPVGSQGSFDSLRLFMLVQQNLGSGIRVYSQSDMTNPGLTLYLEVLWMNGRKKTQSEIRYQREAP